MNCFSLVRCRFQIQNILRTCLESIVKRQIYPVLILSNRIHASGFIYFSALLIHNAVGDINKTALCFTD